jgi:mono/diheme cytochrome c family protein
VRILESDRLRRRLAGGKGSEGGFFGVQLCKVADAASMKGVERTRTIMRSRDEITLAAFLALLSVLPIPVAASPQGDPESGRKLYVERCQACHGPTGKGDSAMAAQLKPPPANLAAKSTQAKTDAELRKVIREGRPGTAMVSFGGVFNETQLTNLIAYIRLIGS